MTLGCFISLSLSCLRMTIFKYCLFNTQLHLQQHLVFPVIRVLSGPALQTPLPRGTARHVKRFSNNIDGYIVDVYNRLTNTKFLLCKKQVDQLTNERRDL